MNRRRSPVWPLTAAVVMVMVSCPSAGAITPPEVDPQVTPPAGSAGPSQPMEQRSQCVTSGLLGGSDLSAPSPNQLALNLSGAWSYSRGEGQTVAVIDTGVQPGPRLPNVEPGGDYVQTTDGLTDCDGHGTFVAGLIAGQPGADGFSGVAPAARLISIRQTSEHYAPRAVGGDPTLSRASTDVTNLARAVVRAADLGARVIQVSTVTCLPANKTIDQAELGAALKYAAVDKDAVIVAAAGNDRSGITSGVACESNPLADPSRPDDPSNWDGVTTVSIPSVWQPFVLSVGSLTATGQPSDFTVAGPWVGIAAPGERITSVSNAPGGALANGLPNNDQELVPVSGTSYAAAYVSGVAALVRSRFPQLTAAEVKQRLTATAHSAARTPSGLVGAGNVDPVAALTWDVSTVAAAAEAASVKPVAAPLVPSAADHTPRYIAFAGASALALAVLATAYGTHRRKDKAT